jgi:hypothetical protein
MYAITKACSTGALADCGCAARPAETRADFQWGGCSDDVKFGAEFSKRFTDPSEDVASEQGLVNLHNNDVGRRVSVFGPMSLEKPFRSTRADKVKQTEFVVLESTEQTSRLLHKHTLDDLATTERMRLITKSSNNQCLLIVSRSSSQPVPGQMLKANMDLICKCHGVSGSCTVRICWRKLKAFRVTGEQLLTKYQDAALVRFVQRNNRLRMRPAGRSRRQASVRISRKQLVYMHKSPDHCTQR